MKALATVLLACAVLAPSIASAQEPAAPGTPLRDTTRLHAQLFEAQRYRWFVRADLHGNRVAQGRVRYLGEEETAVGVRKLAIGEIRRLERERFTGGAAKGGFIAGTVVGTVMTYSMAQGICDTSDCGPDFSRAILILPLFAGIGAVVGGVPGAVLGSILDPPRREWVPLWP